MHFLLERNIVEEISAILNGTNIDVLINTLKLLNIIIKQADYLWEIDHARMLSLLKLEVKEITYLVMNIILYTNRKSICIIKLEININYYSSSFITQITDNILRYNTYKVYYGFSNISEQIFLNRIIETNSYTIKDYLMLYCSYINQIKEKGKKNDNIR